MCHLLNIFYFLCFSLVNVSHSKIHSPLPLVINTWGFSNATEKAWKTLYANKGSAIDAVEDGCSTCERLQCDGTVGFGGSPDEYAETTLDAMIMNGIDLSMGAVAGLRRIKNAISVARHVMDHTQHSLLVGDQATKFAIRMGFKEEGLTTAKSILMWQNWKNNDCQPNFWKNVVPDPTRVCGPYYPVPSVNTNVVESNFNALNHDTIGMIVVDENHNIAAGTSTNGAKYKIPGRVGDSPIPGAGAYADNDVGAAAATGDGDVMMRVLPSFIAVEEMRHGKSPDEAARIAIKRVTNKYPKFFGGVIAVDKSGKYGAACNGMDKFPYSVRNLNYEQVVVKTVSCVSK